MTESLRWSFLFTDPREGGDWTNVEMTCEQIGGVDDGMTRTVRLDEADARVLGLLVEHLLKRYP